MFIILLISTIKASNINYINNLISHVRVYIHAIAKALVYATAKALVVARNPIQTLFILYIYIYIHTLSLVITILTITS